MAGCVGLVATGVNVLLMPAAIVGLLAGVSGVRRAGDDLDAGMRLGVALLISVLVAVLSVMSGSGVLAAAGVVTVAMFALAWRSCEQLRRQRRSDWGVKQRGILERHAELHQRRDALRNAPVVDHPGESRRVVPTSLYHRATTDPAPCTIEAKAVVQRCRWSRERSVPCDPLR